jgi:hypothetical protein
MIKELLRRIWYLCNRRRLEREMGEEMAYHRELMSPDRRTNFGNELRLREDAREVWGWTWLDRRSSASCSGSAGSEGIPQSIALRTE